MGAVLLFAIASVSVAGFYASANRTIWTFLGDFRQQRQLAVQAALSSRRESVVVTAKDYATWDEMFSYVENPDPAWSPDNLDWIVSDLGYAFVQVLRSDGSLVYQRGTVLDWPADLSASLVAHFAASLAEESDVQVMAYVPGEGSLYWVAGARVVHSEDTERTGVYNGYLLIGDILAPEEFARIESFTGLEDLHVRLLGESELLGQAQAISARLLPDSQVEPANRDAPFVSASPYEFRTPPNPARGWASWLLPWDQPSSGELLEDAYPLEGYLGPHGLMVHYTTHLPLAEAQISRWRNGSAFTVATIVIAMLGCFAISHHLFVRPFVQLGSAVSRLASSGRWESPRPRYREFQAFADALTISLESRAVANRALAEGEQRYRAVVEDLPLFICRFNSARRMTFVNDALCHYFGKRPEQLLGTDFLQLVPPQDQEQVRAELAALGPARPISTYEHSALSGEGKIRWVRWTDRAICDSDGRVIGFQSIGQDITEQRELEERFRQSQRMETVGRLAGGVAHDFNNILTAIMGHASFALQSAAGDAVTEADIQEVLKSAERARNLTQQLLAFSRKQIIEPKLLDLNDLILDMDRMLRRLIGESIELVTLPCRDLGLVKADPGQIEQVLINLVVNAHDAMPHGGTLTIETLRRTLDESYSVKDGDLTPGDYVMLAVSDTGEGMSEETLSHLFEPFFTTKSAGEGTGLGLATVHGIVKQHRGHIWVYSEVGKGSTFKVYLPLAQEKQVCDRTDESEASKPTGAEVVLVAEDEPAVRHVAVRMLQRLGYRVLEATTGEEALRLARSYQGPVHLLLTDVVMPQMGGRELAGRLKAIRPESRVLFVSGYTHSDVHHHGVLDDGVHFLQKPFTEVTLARKVREALDGHAEAPDQFELAPR